MLMSVAGQLWLCGIMIDIYLLLNQYLYSTFNSNMTSFIGYINNTVVKLTIYFNSLMRIDEQITNIIP